MAEHAKKFENLSKRQLSDVFTNTFRKLGYNTHPNGHPITSTVNPSALSFVNCSMAPYIGELEQNKDTMGFTIHEASVQPSVRLNSLGEDNLLVSPHWMTSFEMAGAITSTTPINDVTKQVAGFLTKEVGIEVEKLHYIAKPGDRASHSALLEAGVNPDKIHFQKENTQIFVDWNYGIPGLAGTGITICYVPDESKLANGTPNPDSQFLNIITVDKYDDGKKVSEIANPFIDMGFGVDRLVSLLKECTPFELEGRKEILDSAISAAKTKYGVDSETDKRLLTLTDHIFTTKLLLDQGIRPTRRDSTKRGYLLRKMIRNALLQANMLQIDPHFIEEQLSGYTTEIRPEIDEFIKRVATVEEHIGDIRLSWLQSKDEQRGSSRPRFSNKESIKQFQAYVEEKYSVPSEITLKYLRKIDREVFYLSGFHERYYPYPTIGEEEAIADTNVTGIAQMLKEHNVENVVDFGCGKGRHSIALAKRKFKVTALDFDPASINAFKQKISHAGIENITPIEGDGFHLDKYIEPESQDAALIFYTSVLASGERSEDLATLKQMKGTLKKDGVFMWSVTNLDGVKKFWMPGDALPYKNNDGEAIVYAEKRELTQNGRILAHPVAYRVDNSTGFGGELSVAQDDELNKYRFVVIESDNARYIVYKDGTDHDFVKSAQIITSEEGLLSIQPYTQGEVKKTLTELGFDDIQFHKGIKPDTFNSPSDGDEFDIVVTAINK